VIAVLAVMLSVLLPSLNKAKEQAKSVYCRSNLRQLAIAAFNYNLSNDGYFPLAQYTTEGQRPLPPAPEMLSVNAAIPEEPSEPMETVTYMHAWDFTMIMSSRGVENVPGLLWQGDTIEKVQQCPAYKGVDNWGGIQFTGYNYNTSYIGHGQGEIVGPDYSGRVIPHPVWPSWCTIVMPAKETDINSPNQCALFGDGHYAGGANKFMRAPQAWSGDISSGLKLAGTQGYRHLNRTNLVFSDGHAESIEGLFTDIEGGGKTRLDEHNDGNRIKIGFISSGNSLYDLK
ncbi:MAG: hypothetical protein ACYSOZ_00190, partial [Planctomycetota bacterium]